MHDEVQTYRVSIRSKEAIHLQQTSIMTVTTGSDKANINKTKNAALAVVFTNCTAGFTCYGKDFNLI